MPNFGYFNPASLLISFLKYRDVIEITSNFFSAKDSKANKPSKYYRKNFKKYRS